MFDQRRRHQRHSFHNVALLGYVLLTLPACHQPMPGRDIDLPAPRPGRFDPQAAPAEQRAAQQDQRKEEAERKRHPQTAQQSAQQKAEEKEEEHYEPLPPEYGGGGANGPIKTQNGHTVTPQTNVIYGSPPSRNAPPEPAPSSEERRTSP